MFIVRLRHRGIPRWAALEGEAYRLFSSPTPWEDDHLEGPTYPFQPTDLMAPACPGKIVAIGLNYLDHNSEMKMDSPADPVLFLKPPSALLDPGGTILLPRVSERVDYEAELAVVFKKRVKNATPAEARDALWGYTCCNDVTARDLQKKDGQWTRAKGYDTFCPLGPWLNTTFQEKDQSIRCRVNGSLRQESRLSSMIHRVTELVSFISSVMTLDPLDVLTTGTPSGIGPLKSGDRVEVDIEGIGTLWNLVK